MSYCESFNHLMAAVDPLSSCLLSSLVIGKRFVCVGKESLRDSLTYVDPSFSFTVLVSSFLSQSHKHCVFMVNDQPSSEVAASNHTFTVKTDAYNDFSG